MANRLFDAPDLVEVQYGDGPWTIGFQLQATRAAMELMVQDPCTEVATYVSGSKNPSAPLVYNIQTFSAVVSARRNLRCANGEELEIVTELLQEGGLISAAEYGLWNGLSSWDPNLNPSIHANDVITVSAGSSVADSISNAIVAYSTATVFPDYIVHLGVDAAIDLSALGYTETVDQSGQLRLRATGAPIVVSPNYPASGIAVTPPLLINIGDPTAYQVYDYKLNRTNIVGYQLIAIAFDPSTTIRVAP